MKLNEQQEAEIIFRLREMLPRGAAFILLTQYKGTDGVTLTAVMADGVSLDVIPAILVNTGCVLQAEREEDGANN